MLPLETIVAVFPGAVQKGGDSFRPLTLAHVCAMEALGVDMSRDIPPENALLAAAVMAQDAGCVSAMVEDFPQARAELEEAVERFKARGESVDALVERVNAVMDAAFVTFVPGGTEDGRGRTCSLVPAGYGWPLEYADLICHEYGWRFDEVMTMPLSRMFGLIACARARSGGKAGGPDYYERVALKEIAELRRRTRDGAEGGGGDG